MPSSRERSRFSVAAFAPPELRLATPLATAALAPAGSEALTAAEESYRLGYAEGLAARDDDADRLRDDAVAALGAAIEGLSTVSRDIRDRLGANLPALALALARHLVQREVSADPTIMRDLVERALAMTPLAGTVTVRLNPADFSALGDVSAFAAASPTALELKWIADPAILRGGCLVETAASVVDGRVDHALLDLYERLCRE